MKYGVAVIFTPNETLNGGAVIHGHDKYMELSVGRLYGHTKKLGGEELESAYIHYMDTLFMFDITKQRLPREHSLTEHYE